MVKKEVIIKNEIGLRGRFATLFVRVANNFISEVFVQQDNVNINGKSILGIMSLGLSKDCNITILVNGPDEENAIVELINIMNHDSISKRDSFNNNWIFEI